MANLNLLDIVKMNNTDAIAGLVAESIQASPEAKVGASRTIKGTSYKTLHRTAFPTAGFRDANEGAAAVKSTYKNKLVQTFIMDVPIEVDKAVADAHEDGRDAVLSIEAAGVLEAAFRALSSQFYYGRNANSVYASAAGSPTKGFPGIVDVVSSDNTKDATGTTASTGSSVIGVKWGVRDVTFVVGQNGEITSGDVREVRLTDGSGNPYDGYRIPFLAYVGLQVINPNSICRIKNITEDTGKGLTDDLIFSMLSQLPAGVIPEVFYLTKRSMEQLRASRTATNATGAPAPLPTEVAGIPLVETGGIVNTEEIV